MKLPPNRLKIELQVYWQARYEYFIYEDMKRSTIPESWALVGTVTLDIPIDTQKLIEDSLLALERERQKVVATAHKEQVEIERAQATYLRLKWSGSGQVDAQKEPEFIAAGEEEDPIPF